MFSQYRKKNQKILELQRKLKTENLMAHTGKSRGKYRVESGEKYKEGKNLT